MVDPTSRGWLGRLRRTLRRADVRHRRRRLQSRRSRALTGLICALAGLMIAVSALNARGVDLRPGRNTDLIGLVQSESRRNADLARQLTDLRAQVDQLSSEQNTGTDGSALTRASQLAGTDPVVGPALSVTLDDAPADEVASGIDQDLLVVHQEDIQSIVNLLWSAGAEALTIQGQRVIATTGVKCVGNTVVLHGIPYAPPYVISAIGDQRRMQATLAGSNFVRIYKQYVERYRLGYSETLVSRATFPAYQGSLELEHARVPGSESESPSGSPS